MLVVTRKPGEGIVIGDDVVIKIIELKGGGIRIGIEAPFNKKIYRQEVYDRISRQNREALQWNMTDLDVLSDNLLSKERDK
jgi:carbon storage regulator